MAHTLSPAIHNAAFNHLKLDFVYLAFRVKATDLEDAMRGTRALGIHGLNVTMPHKNKVVNYLDEKDPTVQFLGSANTIAFSLAPGVGELVVLNRATEKAAKLAEALRQASDKTIVSGSLSKDAVSQNIADSDVLINATSVGMHPAAGQSVVPPQSLRSDLTVMDIVYNPIETKLAKDAKAAGAKVISGVEMLIHQGAASFKIFTGKPAPIEVMRKAALNKLSSTGVKE
jgi:shikimate dehydrogenase